MSDTLCKFYVKAVWNKEQEIWESYSNIVGLHVETTTHSGFFKVVENLIEDLMKDNYDVDMNDDAYIKIEYLADELHIIIKELELP